MSTDRAECFHTTRRIDQAWGLALFIDAALGIWTVFVFEACWLIASLQRVATIAIWTVAYG